MAHQHCVLSQCLFSLSLLFLPVFLPLSSFLPFSLSDDKPESDDPAEYLDQSETEQLSPLTAVQWERRGETYPSKRFLSSGLYSDDYKTTE